MEKSKNNKRELKIVFSSEIYDELKYVFRKDQLKNIIYRPMIIDEKRWLCSCGYETENDVCPICGMEKNTVFSKVNANYLIRHRKMRLARHTKSDENKKAMMAQMIKPTKKQKQKKNNKRLGTLIGVLVLCIALVISFVMIFGSANEERPPVEQTTETPTTPTSTDTQSPETDTPTSDNATESTPADDTTEPPASETTPPETDPPATEPPVNNDGQPTVVPTENVTVNVATVPEGKVASGASGNTSMGGLVYSGTSFDYIAKDGITVLDKNGNVNSVLTTSKALTLSGNDKYIVYVAEDNTLHVIDVETKKDTPFTAKAKSVAVAFDRIYYTPFGENGLYSIDFDGKGKQILTDKEVFALNATADKLYFSTSESLCVLSSKDGPVQTFCPDGACATSIIEITNFVFYTAKDGKLKYYNPNRPAGYSVEYPVYIGNVTALIAFENRVYIRVDNAGNISWRTTTWQEGTKLFDAGKFTATSITTPSIFVTNNAIFDGELNRTSIQ